MDSLCLMLITQELSEQIVSSVVRKVYEMPDGDFLLKLWGKGEKWLLISFLGRNKGVFLIDGKDEQSKTPSSFCMLLRKYTEGSRILSISNPRLQKSIYVKFSPNSQAQGGNLVIELFGREGNIILLDDKDGIIKSYHKVSTQDEASADSGKIAADRALVGKQLQEKRRKYIPLMSEKKDPLLILSEFHVRKCFEDTKDLDGIEDAFCRVFFHINRMYAREILMNSDIHPARKVKEITPDEWTVLFNSWRSFWTRVKEGRIEPSLIQVDADEKKSLCCLWPFREFASSQFRRYGSLNELFKEYLLEKTNDDTFEVRKKVILSEINSKLKKLARRLDAVSKDLSQAKNNEDYKSKGELLIMNKHSVKKGDSSVSIDNVFKIPLQKVQIELDPRLSPMDNANRYFERYKKLKRALNILSVRKEDTEKELEYWNELSISLEQAKDDEELDDIQTQLLLPSSDKKKADERGKPVSSGPRKYVFRNYEILVGKNPKQNDELTLKIAKSEDLWFHARGMPGAHTILRLSVKKKDEILSPDVVMKAAQLAAYYSKGRNSSKVPVSYTYAKYVKKTRHMHQGMVSITREKTITVDPQDEDFLKWIKSFE